MLKIKKLFLGNLQKDKNIFMSQSTFLRNSSGLVKSANPADVLIFNLGLISVGIAVTLAHFFVPSGYTGANFSFSRIHCWITYGNNRIYFLCWTVAIPRSGGSYSFVSRGVHPLIGFGVSFIDTVVWLFYNTFAATFIVTIGISPALFTLGVTYDNSELQNLGIILQQPIYTFIIASISIILSGFILIRGMKTFYLFQKIMFFTAIFGTLCAILVLVQTSSNDFISHLISHLHNISKTLAKQF